METKNDYDKAKELKLIYDRWSSGAGHHPNSIRLMNFLAELDFNYYEDLFHWKMGGDGDNGEALMFQMDTFFELLDILNKEQVNNG